MSSAKITKPGFRLRCSNTSWIALSMFHVTTFLHQSTSESVFAITHRTTANPTPELEGRLREASSTQASQLPNLGQFTFLSIILSALHSPSPPPTVVSSWLSTATSLTGWCSWLYCLPICSLHKHRMTDLESRSCQA